MFKVLQCQVHQFNYYQLYWPNGICFGVNSVRHGEKHGEVMVVGKSFEQVAALERNNRNNHWEC